MTEDRLCPKCGSQVPSGENFCPHCGTRMNDGEFQVSSERMKTYEEQKQIKRTSTGIGLMIGGLILSWLPIIQFLGALLEFIGAILIILGRNAFGKKHSDYVTMALILFIFYFFGSIINESALFSSLQMASGSFSASTSAYINYNIAYLVLVSIAGLSQMLLVLGISNRNGTIILLLAFLSQSAVSVFLYTIIVPMVTSAASKAVSMHSTAPLSGLLGRIEIYELIYAIPALIFAVGYYLARQRVEKKGILENAILPS